MGKRYAIKTNKLSKLYGNIKAVNNLDLTVREGEVYSFLGPNGAGKTTTIRMLLKFINPTAGSFAFGDYLDPLVIGYIPGDIELFEKYTSNQIVDYFRQFYSIDQEYLDKLLERFELDPTRKINELSKGNKQKVSIVLAFMHQPKLFILDEPTSGLDPLLQNEFYQLIKDVKSDGATVFFSSHILSEVEKVSDRVGLIKDGRLISVREVTELMHSRSYKVRLVINGESSALQSLEGFSHEIKHEGKNYSFLYTGDVNSLLKTVTQLNIDGISISEPSLEDLFLTMYGENHAE